VIFSSPQATRARRTKTRRCASKTPRIKVQAFERIGSLCEIRGRGRGLEG
jgi:hypothetical protein